jgi:hypothetical protein
VSRYSDDQAAWQVERDADRFTATLADLAGQVPAPSGEILAWWQDMVRGGYEDAARLTEQPRGW